MFPIIDMKSNYYLIKTNNGYYYQNYINNNIVSLYSLQVNDNLEINKPHKKKELEIFINELSLNDYVLIPNYRNRLISIGQITSNYFLKDQNIYRKVKWLKTLKINDLLLLSKYLSLNKTIIKINDLDYLIDRNVYQYFIKDHFYHIIIAVKQEENILCKSLYGLYDLLLSDIDKQELQIKVSLESPGIIELISENLDVIIAIIKVIKLIHLLTKKEKINDEKIKQKYEEYEIDKLKLECPNFPNNS